MPYALKKPHSFRTPRSFSHSSQGKSQRRLPVAEMNLTPLIDVLLVLIVMLILTVPLATHSLKVPLPAPGPAPYQLSTQNTVTISANDELIWNGKAMSEDLLLGQLAATAKLEQEATVRFEPDANASYDRSAKTIALIKDAGVERFAFVGNERHRAFDKQ